MSEKIVQLNEEVIKGQLKELVRGSVEETLNELLEAEAQKLTQAARYERNEQRQGYRSGHYSRNLTTTSGDVTLKVPKLKGISFETAIIERYRRRESSVEEALIEMYLAGVSVRRVEDITEALWGSKVSPSTISELNKKAYVHIEDWRNRPLQGGRYPYVYVDGIYLRRNWGGEFENVAILVAIAVNEDGYREVLGAAEGMKEDKASWVSFCASASSSSLRVSSTLPRTNSLSCPLITSSFSCTIFSDMVCCLLSEWCVVTSFYQRAANHVFFCPLFNFAKLILPYPKNC